MFKKKVLLIACSVFILTGCVPKLSNGKELVAETNKGKITVDELYEQVKSRYATNILMEMLDKMLLDELYPTDDEMVTKINAQISSIKEQTGDDFISAIQYYYGVNNETQLYDYIEISLKKQLAVENYAKGLITDDEVNKYYNETSIGDVRASHILITPEETESGATEEEIAAKEEEAKKKAEELISKLNNGEDFATLAKENSDDGSASNGGDLGYFNLGDMVKEFEDAVLALNVNEYTKTPIKTSYGYHIILKTDQKEKPELQYVKDDIITKLAQEKMDEDVNFGVKALYEIRKQNNVIIHDSELSKQYEEYIKNIDKTE